MSKLKHVVSSIGSGAVGVPVVVGSFVFFSSDAPGWAGFKASMVAEGKMFLFLAVVGAAGGLLYGVFTALRPQTAS